MNSLLNEQMYLQHCCKYEKIYLLLQKIYFNMKDSRVFLGIIVTTFLHSYCCVFPLFIGLWGSVSILGGLLAFQPVFWLIQGGVLGFSLFRYYFRNPKPTRKQRVRIAFVWVLFIYSVAVYIVPHTDWFKSEDEILMQRQLANILKIRSAH